VRILRLAPDVAGLAAGFGLNLEIIALNGIADQLYDSESLTSLVAPVGLPAGAFLLRGGPAHAADDLSARGTLRRRALLAARLRVVLDDGVVLDNTIVRNQLLTERPRLLARRFRCKPAQQRE
jgi:hypothetical protein